MRDSGQARLCKSSRSQDSERFSEPQFGKNGKGAYYDHGPEF